MSNKETLQSYNTELGNNNIDLETVLNMVNNLPEAGVGEINLQDKSITITENGTQTITADSGYDGLNNVEVTTNISGGETPEVGFVVNEWNSSGYATKVTTYGMTTLPAYALSSYSSYKSLVSKYLKTLILNNGMTTIATYACYNNSTIQTVVLPNTIETISNSAFLGCSALETVNLPDVLSTIEQKAFHGCKNLVLNTLPDTVTSIDGQSFQECTSLTQISFRNVNSLAGTSRNMGRFYGCTGLKAVWVGSPTRMGEYDFQGCTSMLKMFINLPRTTVEAFSGYSYKFMYNADSTVEIICNDDEGFMTKEEFDAIDWATYTG